MKKAVVKNRRFDISRNNIAIPIKNIELQKNSVSKESLLTASS